MAIICGYIDILIAFLSFLMLCHLCWNRNSPIRNWPLFGMLPGILHNRGTIHEFAAQVLEKSGGTVWVKGPWFVSMNFLMTSDPKNVQHIVNKRFENYAKGAEFREIFEILGDGIFISDGDAWKSQRKMIHSLLKNKRFVSALDQKLLQNLEGGLLPILEHSSKFGTVVDVQDVLQRLMFDNFCFLVLGFDPKCLSIELPEIAYEKAYDVFEEVILYRHIVPQNIWKLQKWLQIGQEKKFKRAQEIFDNFLHDCILLKQEKIREMKDEIRVHEFDVLTVLMLEEQQNGGFEMSKKSLRDIAFNLLAAGRDTVGAALVWFIWLVATHPLVEQKILEEIKMNIPKNKSSTWRIFDAHETSKLVYLHAAICEALRLYPSVPFTHKCSVQPDILPSGHHVNANTRIIISIYAMGRSKEIWGEDYLEFRPERWITVPGEILHVPSYNFMAFLSGPRACLGKDMAITLMKIISTSILWNYHVEVVEGHPAAPSLSILLYMKQGLKVKLHKRHA